MKKLILVFSKFLLISSIIYCLVIIVLYKKNIRILSANIPNKEQRRYGFTAKKLEDAKKIKKVDVVLLGSSLCFRNYHPEILKNNGYTSFSFGTSAQKPNMTYVMASKYLQNIKSKIVIIDVNPYLMLTPDTFETVDFIMNSPTNSSDFKMLKSAPSLMAFNALIIKYTGFAENDRQEKITDSVSDKKDKYLGNGFVSSGLMYDENTHTPQIKVADFQPLQNQSESLDKLIEFLKSKKINYILVLSPINEHYFLTKSKIKKEQFKKLSRNYFSKYGNYYDSNDLEKYNKTDFMDFSHLNENGAKKFTNSLIPVLKTKIKR